MRLSRALSALALAALAAACGERVPTVISLSAAPARVELAPGNFATINLTGTYDGDQLLPEGGEITFSTELGSFAKEGTEQSASTNIKAGKASVKLYPPSSPGKAVVKATYIDPYNTEVTDEIEVNFVTPVVTKLNFSCAAFNLGVYVTQEDFEVKCDATPEDAEGKPVRFARVRFLTEAGEFELGDTDEEGRKAWLYHPRQGGREPKNVPPMGDEPKWVDQSSGNRERNPRDGLVSLVAFVEGDNGGVSGEPFVDANDDKSFTAGEEFHDVDGDGEYSDTQDKYIWKQIKVLWTGPLHREAPASKVVANNPGNNFDLAVGATLSLTYTLLDRNLNALAANGAGDSISFQAFEGSATPVGGSVLPLKNAFGLDLNNKFELNNPSSRDTYTRDCTYTVTIRNDNTDENPQPYQFFGAISRSLSVDSAGAATNGHDEESNYASGTLAGKPGGGEGG